MNRRNVFVILTILFLIITSLIIAFFARGYRLDIKTAKIAPTGILVATSDPDGAEVFIDGKLTTATNNTINLAPGKYLVKISKDGFNSWEKLVTIKTEEVFKTNAFLFPSLPELRPLTLTGAKNPLLSPDSSKIVYAVASASAEKNGLWIIDMSRNFPFSNSDFRQISHAIFSNLSWTSDSKELVATTPAKLTFLLESDHLNDAPVLITRIPDQTLKPNPTVPLGIASTSSQIKFSPDESKIFYLASVSAALSPLFNYYLPGTNPTPESRSLKIGNYYVYDFKEDRNYVIENCKPASPAGGLKNVNCVWFPSSRHLLSYSANEIAIMEYDGTNRAVIYAGPFKPNLVAPWPNWSKIVILTTFNGTNENLYTINLR